MNAMILAAMERSEVLAKAFELMGWGMGGIFAVMSVISLIVWLITKFSK